MTEAAIPSKPPIRRKKPREERGRSWRTFALSMLYREDLEYIYSIMLDYSAKNPNLILQRKTRERLQESHSLMNQMRSEHPDALADFQLPDPGPEIPSVTIDADDYIAYSVDELLAWGIRSIKDTNMRVGINDLTLSIDEWGAGLQINDDNPNLVSAFDEIKARLRTRERAVFRHLFQRQVFAAWTVGAIAALLISLFTDGLLEGMAWAYVWTSLVLIVGWHLGFVRKRPTVILVYEGEYSLPWYRSDPLKVGLVLVAAGAFVAYLTRRG